MKMIHLRQNWAAAVLLLYILAASPAAVAAGEGSVQPVKGCNSELYQRVRETTSGFRDFTATVVVEYKNDEVLAKVGKRYAQQYELKKATVRFKAPGKTRLEGSIGALKFIYITNQDHKIIKIKPVGYEKKESIVDEPHKRQGASDLGLITKDLWDEYVVEDRGSGRAGEEECHILDLTRGDKFSNLHRVWVNKQTLCLMKMEKYDPDKVTLRLFYRYLEPKQINGIWVPTKIEMYSPASELAGITRFQDIKVNTGLQDSFFK